MRLTRSPNGLGRLAAVVVATLLSVCLPVPETWARDYDFVSVYSEQTDLAHFPVTYPAINSSGVVAFAVGSPDGSQWMIHKGGVGMPLTPFFGFSGAAPQALAINDGGAVAVVVNFAASYQVIRIDPDGSARVLAEADPAASTPYLEFSSSISMNNAGQVAVLARNDDSTQSILRLDESGVVEIARSSAGLSAFSAPSINDAGVVAFKAETLSAVTHVFTGSGGPLTDEGVPPCNGGSGISPKIGDDGRVLSDCGGPLFTVRAGVVDVLLTGTEDPIFTRFTGTSRYSLSKAGQPAFVTSNGLGTEAGLFTGNEPVGDKVVRTGDVVFGDSAVEIRMGDQSINDIGQITFLLEVGSIAHVVLANPQRTPQTISFALLSTRSFGDPPFVVDATASSGLPVTFTASGQCSVSGSTVTLLAAGSCTIQAFQAGDATYLPAPTVSQTFEIQRASQTIVFDPLPNRRFGDPPFAIAATASSGLGVSFGIAGSCGFSGNAVTVALTGAGTCVVTATQFGDSNYLPAPDVVRTFTISRAGQTITFDALPGRSFGDVPFSVNATASSGLLVNFAVTGNCTIAGNVVSLIGAGSCIVTASQAGDANYDPASDVAQTFPVARASQSIAFATLPDRAFGDAPFTITATATSGLAVSFAAAGSCTITSSVVSLTGAGSCTVTASQPGDANYAPAPDVARTFLIARRPQTITFAPLADRSFGEPPFSVTATASSGLTVSFAAGGACSVVGNVVTLTTVGTCTVAASQPGDANYLAAVDVARAFVVSAQAQTTTGPIAYWPGDGSAVDVVGVHHGVLTNGTAFAPGRVGNAFAFDGIDDYVAVADAPDLAFGTGDFTVSFWVNFNDLTSHSNGLIHKDNYSGTSTYNGWLFDICEPCEGGGGVGFLTRHIVGDAGPFTFAAYSTANFQVGQWYHIAGVRQANVLYLYVDGVLRASAAESVPTDVSNTIDLRLGSLSPASPQFFNGLLDEVKIHRRALLASEVAAAADAIVAWWAAEGTAADGAGGGHDGVLTNGATFAPGRVGNAFAFDGIDDYVAVPDAPDLAFGTGDFTVGFWVNFDDLTSHSNGLIHKDSYSGSPTYNGWLFDICEPCEGGGGIGFLTRNIVGDVGPFTFVAYSTANFQVGQWYHIAGVRQANVLYLYVDGVLRATAAESGPTDVSNNGELRLGSLSPASPQFFNGLLDEVKIHSRALSASEVGVAAGLTPQTITFGPLLDRTYGDPTFTVSATASSGLPASFSASGSCSASGSTITITGAGSCTVTASQGGNATYAPAPDVARSFTVARAAQTINFAALQARTFGDPPFTVSATASSGLPVSFAATGSCLASGATVTLTGAGSCAITASQGGNVNNAPAPSVGQSFTIARATTTASIAASPSQSNVGQAVTITATVSSGVGVPTNTVTFKDGSTVLGIAVLAGGQASLITSALTPGMHTLTVEYGGDTNYLPSVSSSLSEVTLTTGRDLVETAVSAPPGAIVPAGAFPVTDTVLNQGQVAAVASTTRYYLSSNGTAKTKLLTGTRSVPGLNPGASSPGAITVTVPANTVLGQYYLLACADDTTSVSESNESNNCRSSTTTVQVTRPDLLATTVSFTPGVVLPGGTLSVTDTVVNQSLVGAGASTARYYLSADAAKDASDRLLSGTRAVPALGPNGTSTASATTVTVPANMPLGTYLLLACADDTSVVTETNETNNCVASGASVRIGRPDLREAAVSDPPTLALPGGSFTVTDTVQNQGDIPAATTTTRYYLSMDQVRNAGDQLLSGSRSVPALASSGTSSGPVIVTIPGGTALGTYYLLACADDQAPKVAEGDETNNCLASVGTVQVTRPDLVETAVSNPPPTLARGGSFTVTDTVVNQGLVAAGASTTRYYLSADTIKDSGDKRLTGTRAVPVLGPGAASNGNATVTIPGNTVLGTYFLLGCADDTTSVAETDETDNCIASAGTVTVTP